MLARALISTSARQELLPGADPREVVSTANALDAILLLAQRINTMERAGALAPLDADMLSALLMVVRDHIQPLPVVHLSEGGDDIVTEDLATIISMLLQGELRAREGSH